MQWSIHYILDELIFKANELPGFEVLVQKLVPSVSITQCMQERERLSLGSLILLQDEILSLTLMTHLLQEKELFIWKSSTKNIRYI